MLVVTLINDGIINETILRIFIWPSGAQRYS